MLSLVTLGECYEHLRLDFDSNGSADDAWLEVFIPAISASIRNWLKDEFRLYVPFRDSSGEIVYDSSGEWEPELDVDGLPIPAPEVRAACLIEIGAQYRYREGEGKDNWVPSDAGYGYVLNKASTALLTPLRKPTVR